MSYGLEIYGPNGNVRLSASDRLTRFLGATTVNVPSNTSVFVAAPPAALLDWTAKVSALYTSHFSETLWFSQVSNGIWLYTPYGSTCIVVFMGL